MSYSCLRENMGSHRDRHTPRSPASEAAGEARGGRGCLPVVSREEGHRGPTWGRRPHRQGDIIRAVFEGGSGCCGHKDVVKVGTEGQEPLQPDVQARWWPVWWPGEGVGQEIWVCTGLAPKPLSRGIRAEWQVRGARTPCHNRISPAT